MAHAPAKQRSRPTVTPTRSMLRYAFDLLKVAAGALCIALSIALFLAPNNVAPGGLAGLALLFEAVSGTPIGLTLIVVNAVLLVIGARYLGATRFVLKTIVGVTALSIGVEAFDGLWPAPTEEPLLLAVYGGLLDGLGIALAFRGGGTTGGMDIIARLVNRKFGTAPGISMLVVNVCVYTIAASIFGLEQAMLALLVSFVSARTLDAITQGVVATRTVLIISESPDDVIEVVAHVLGYGVTQLDGKGGYSGRERAVLLTVVPRADVLRLRRRVLDADHDAFMTFLPSRGVVGGHALPLED